MKLTSWKQVAEILSGLAVIVTLIILILEIQENTAVTKANSYSNSVQSLNEWRYEIAGNPELSDIFLKHYAKNVGDLTDIQHQRLIFMMSALWAIYEDAFYSRGYDTLGSQEFGRYEVQICFHYELGKKSGTRAASASRITDSFKRHIENACAQ